MMSPHILFAPVLRSEGWLSIDLQQQNILDALSARFPELPMTVLHPDESRVGNAMSRRWLRDFRYPRLIQKEAAQLSREGRVVMHVGDHSYGHLCRAYSPCVINCNDLHHFVEPRLDPIRLQLWRRRVKNMRHAARVLTISAHLAGEVMEHLHLPEERVTALPGGIDTAVFQTLPLEEAAMRMPQVAALRTDHLLVANIGTNYWRKNLPTTLRAVHHLVTQERLPVKLLKVGPALRGGDHEPLIQELGIANHVVDLGRLSPEQVAAVCVQSHALSFPSLYEGFGRPTLEAQACGLPCVLSDASCMKEIGGEGALYHAPLDHEELAAHLGLVMTNSDARAKMIAAGLENVKRFSWSGYAEKLVRVYQEVAA
jgi:glycosyltransferase involved in cell wall biosynthesis